MEVIFKSFEMREILELAQRVASSDVNVLVKGETGTGKELIARVIHQNSPRSPGPFVAVDCGALAPTLIDSELFGHVKGSFTGASTDRRGLFEEAHGGTLFLDEISEMPVDLQARLLRAIQYRQIRRVGSNRSLELDIRIIAATNQDVAELIQAGKFRRDLYFRLNTVSIFIPPLRERREDIAVLTRHYVERFGRKCLKAPASLSPEVMPILMDYSWPGNVRELENVIERAVVLSKQPQIDVGDLPVELRSCCLSLQAWSPTLRDKEEQYILQVLKRNNGNQTKTAEMLGISYSTLWRKLKKLNGNSSNHNGGAENRWLNPELNQISGDDPGAGGMSA